ncbi:unnamed protein product [Brassicogethes aeneus]|uniref:SUI1 domain-containing protein n=1 Tax=Brassicogethes aeneus TaxID=1431903 RepID=A0A9P0BFP6_BRAAE|nr:unnamed protein product [Brassicogethes aeneus]
MFKKPFKVKSNTQVKGSERKLFKELVLKSFPVLTEEEFNDFLPKKEVLNTVKVQTWEGEVVQVYTVQKVPMIFDVRGVCYPTVYFLWKFPKLLYAFTTHSQVTNFILQGADLMLPGVTSPPHQSGLPKYGNLNENNLCYVNLLNNVAAIAVGLAAQSSQSMVFANGRGRCVKIMHYYGDKLCCGDGVPKLSVPNLGPPEWLVSKGYDEDFPALGQESQPEKITVEEPSEKVVEIVENTTEENIENEEHNTEVDSVEKQDELLKYCFLVAVKYSKTLTLPCLTSNFFKLHMLPACPEGKSLDLKKSSYKKLKPFLEKMVELRVITIKEIKKGVEAITAVSKECSVFSEFYITPEFRPRKDNEVETTTSVVESYIITGNVLPIFQKEGFQKGDTVLGTDVRKYVAKYVKDNNFQDDENPKLVKPKEILRTICKSESPITWEELVERVCESMKNCFKVSSGGGEEMFNKGKVSPINISVSVRSGNKKVTLMDNLELFGIKLSEFAKECQHGVAASTSISRPPGKKCDQLLVQGNQVIFVYNLLIEKYKIPKKYVKGLENAPKKKK